MADRPGTVYWIDHYVVPVTDVDRWSDFYTNVVGAKPREFGEGGPPRERAGRPVGMLFTYGARGCHVGGSVQQGRLAASKGLGAGLPRYGWYIRPEDIDEHLRRLDQFGVAHTDPLKTDEEGEEGTAIRFEDSEGNQLEFWAPVRMPDGAMEDETSTKVGRIASAVFETRDLARSLDFYNQFCDLEPALSGDIPKDTLVFPLGGAGKLVFKKVDELGIRTGGHTVYRALHTAMVVKDDAFLPTLERMWASLPEWDYDPESRQALPVEEAEALPARTGIHGNPIGPEWKRTFGRGDSFYDWDTNTYHFVAAAPVDGSMVSFKPVSQRKYLEGRG